MREGQLILLDTTWVPDAGRNVPSPLFCLFLLVTLESNAVVPILELGLWGSEPHGKCVAEVGLFLSSL